MFKHNQEIYSISFFFPFSLREAAKKLLFNVRKKVPIATKPEGGGAKGLSGRDTKKITFLLWLPLESQIKLPAPHIIDFFFTATRSVSFRYVLCYFLIYRFRL